MGWVEAPSKLRPRLKPGEISVMMGTGKMPGMVGFGRDSVKLWGLEKFDMVTVRNWSDDPKLMAFQFRNDEGAKIDRSQSMMRVHCQAALRMAGARIGHYRGKRDKDTGIIIVNIDDMVR